MTEATRNTLGRKKKTFLVCGTILQAEMVGGGMYDIKNSNR